MIRLFFNPLSKNGKGASERKKYEATLTTEYKVYNVLDYEHLEPLLQSFSKQDEIIVLGGDGTFSQYLRRRGQHRLPVRFVKAGTGNDLLRTVGFDDVLYTSEYDQPVVKTVGVLPFLNTFGLGISNAVLLDYNKSKKNQWTYLKATLKNFFTYQPTTMSVIVDGQSKEYKDVYLVAVQAGQFFGGGMKVTPNADMKDGLLDLIVVHSISRLRLFQVFPSIYSGKHLKYTQYVDYIQGKEIVVESPDRMLFSVDGELSLTTSKTFHISLQ
jgi:diacylglycerol kinase family enzyme